MEVSINFHGFSKKAIAFATLSIFAQASAGGNLYRCVIKDFKGHTATSQVGKLTVNSTVSTIDKLNLEFLPLVLKRVVLQSYNLQKTGYVRRGEM